MGEKNTLIFCDLTHFGPQFDWRTCTLQLDNVCSEFNYVAFTCSYHFCIKTIEFLNCNSLFGLLNRLSVQKSLILAICSVLGIIFAHPDYNTVT